MLSEAGAHLSEVEYEPDGDRVVAFVMRLRMCGVVKFDNAHTLGGDSLDTLQREMNVNPYAMPVWLSRFPLDARRHVRSYIQLT